MIMIECAKMGCWNVFKPTSKRNVLCHEHRGRRVPVIRDKISCQNCNRSITKRSSVHKFCTKECYAEMSKKIRRAEGKKSRRPWRKKNEDTKNNPSNRR